MGLEVNIDLDELHEKVRNEKRTILSNVEQFADAVAESMVNYATSDTGLTVPGSPTNAAGNYIPEDERTPRTAHPGNWADVTGQLANSIKGHVEKNGFQFHLVVQATAEYAAALDAKTGYSVLGGAEQLARKYIRKHKHILFE